MLTYMGSEKRGEEQAAIDVKRSRLRTQTVRVLVPTLCLSSAGLGLVEALFLHLYHGDNRSQPASWSYCEG